MAQPAIPYSGQSLLPVRFWNHAVLGLTRNVPKHEWMDKKYIERGGDALLWSVERLPKIIWEKMQDPRVVTVALTAFALLTNSYLFYPAHTITYSLQVIAHLHLPELWMVKFAAYIHICSLIIGAASRAYGRFANESLMYRFYQNQIV